MPEEKYMRRAIELAKKGSGHVNPNPLVGAVIVRDGEIIGEGYHECYGQLHAERNAIANAKKRGNSLEGSTIYVTLEPCCHYGKTPPCTEAIIEEKIARVVVGSDDPNPLVSGKGFQMLREKGIEVIPHFLKEECDAMNHVFFHYIRTGIPYVAMKYAMTMDGKIACYTGDSKWVTGEESRAHVQTLRNHYKGIMAGIGTVLADDPMLNCRIEGGRDPIRIIADSQSCLFGRSFLGIDQYDSIGSRITIQSCRRRTGQHIDTFNIIRVKIRYSVRTAMAGKRTFTLTKAYIEHRNTVNYIKSIIIFRNGLGTAHHDSRSRTNSTG